MTKWIATLLALLMVLSLSPALAEEDSIRHQVTGDVSAFDVSEEVDQAQEEEATQASVGTDVFLFVDPDTASYVTFVVVDEENNRLANAAIYLKYGGHEEFYGLTDENGLFSTYLFRNTEYGFRVEKSGYRTENGTFTATEATKIVKVVLQKYHTLDIVVLQNGVPLENIRVDLEGKADYTDQEGSVRFWRVNGLYTAEITMPDGSIKTVTIRVQGPTVYVLDIGLNEMPQELMNVLEGGGGDSDLFIVFDKHYAPEDYDLTAKIYTDEELLAQLDTAQMTREEQDTALASWHETNPDYLHIVAEADKEQGTPDRIITQDGEPRFSQRSLILHGRHLLEIEEAGMESILFENEDMGIWLDIADLYSGDMAKLFHLIDAEHQTRKAYPDLSIDHLDVSQFDFDAIPQVWRWMDDPEKKPTLEELIKKNPKQNPQTLVLPILEKELFANARLEVRITPILQSELEKAMLGKDPYYWVKQQDMTELVLISESLEARWFRDYLASGHLTLTEYKELAAQILEGKAYRVQVFMRIDGLEVNVTDILPSLEVRLDVNKQLAHEAAAYADEQLALAENDKARETLEEEYKQTIFEKSHWMQRIRNLGYQWDNWRYEPGDAVTQIVAKPAKGLTNEVGSLQEAMIRALNAKRADVFLVDVRHTPYVHKDSEGLRYFAEVAIHRDASIAPVEDWTVHWPQALSGMYTIKTK
ncbi:MAG: hypothetical protein IJ461_03055 [Clostridia bacterium]|nr:hypothetical protein [Clostridia bacterium]